MLDKQILDIEMLEEVKEKVLFSILEKKNIDFVELAKTKFLLEHDDDSANGFTSWLIHDFVNDGISAVDLYRKSIATSMDKYIRSDASNYDYLSVISGSLYSVFEVVKTKNNVVLKDVITRKDYLLRDDENKFDDALLVGRIYFDGEKVLLSDEHTMYSESFKAVFRKGVLEKYNDYIKVSGIIDIDTFVKENSSIFYKFVDVVEETDSVVNFNDEEFSVYQAVYGFKERKSIMNILDRIENSSKEDYDEYESVYIINLNEISCEVMLLREKLEVECVSKAELDVFKDKIEALLEGKIVHIKDEILTMDELL